MTSGGLLPNPSQWKVTPETARLLQHWRHHPFSGIRPFFCQVEAVETAIWLTEVAPHSKHGKRILEHLAAANQNANPELLRLALKLATGAGKTTVMAMLIAWQTINAVRRDSKNFTRGFLVVAPGLTIKDRLRVLQPNDPDSYYASRELVPDDLWDDVKRAKIVITNFHAFKLRERTDVSKGTRAAIEGWRGETLETLETEGQMLQRVMPDLMGMKNILVLNDEAHHCYREKPKATDDEDLKGDEKKEAEKNNEAARLWISGLESVKTRLPEAQRVVLWSIFEQVRSGLQARNLITQAGLFTRLAAVLPMSKNPPFDFVVVDEAQDISISQLRFFAALGGDRPNILFFAGDLGQRIFQQPFSWKSLGVDIRGRSRTLRVNYRTSHQIRMQADRLLGPEVTDVDGNREERSDTVSVFNGPPPIIRVLKTEGEEIKTVAGWLLEQAKAGVLPHEFGLFVRSGAQLDRAKSCRDEIGNALQDSRRAR